MAQGTDTWLLPVGTADRGAMGRRLAELRRALSALDAPSGVAQLSERLTAELPRAPAVRCAVVAADPADALDAVDVAERRLAEPGLTIGGHAFVGSGSRLRIGFLFPGQGAPVRTDAGAVGERIPAARAAFAQANLPRAAQAVPPEQVQLSVVACSLGALDALRALRVEAGVALGHSLGELTALHWGGAFGRAALLRLARARGHAMTTCASARGGMATVRGDAAAVAELTQGLAVTVACYNAPRQHVVSGAAEAIDAVVARARQCGRRALRLQVVGAFHSPLMEPAVPVFARTLAAERFAPLERPVISSVTGAPLDPADDPAELLARQIVDPVRFVDAARLLAERCDLLLEVGPGRILAGLVGEIAPGVPAVSVRAGEASARGLLDAAAAAFAAGAPVAFDLLRGAAAAPAGADRPGEYARELAVLTPRSEAT